MTDFERPIIRAYSEEEKILITAEPRNHKERLAQIICRKTIDIQRYQEAIVTNPSKHQFLARLICVQEASIIAWEDYFSDQMREEGSGSIEPEYQAWQEPTVDAPHGTPVLLEV